MTHAHAEHKQASGKKLVQHATIKTNPTKESVCKVNVKAVTFDDLWDNYVTGTPYKDKDGNVPSGYENQCAIRMSATLHQVGVEMKSYTPANVDVKPGTKFARILLDGKFASVRADQLGSWLKRQPFCGLPSKPDDITGAEWEKKVKGRKGIIMFDGYWTRDGETSSNASGGHIDLWNGKRLTAGSAGEALSTFGRYVGIRSFRQGTHILPSISYSDLGNSKTILFWEIK